MDKKMNERLQELAREAGFYANPDVEKFEKFAELIIQECADVCQSFGESGDGFTCSAEILEHFGVEQ